MASLDFVIDLLEKIESQGIDYMLVTAQKGKGQFSCDMFYNFAGDSSADCAVVAAKKIISDIEAKYGLNDEAPKKTKKPKKKKGGQK